MATLLLPLLVVGQLLDALTLAAYASAYPSVVGVAEQNPLIGFITVKYGVDAEILLKVGFAIAVAIFGFRIRSRMNKPVLLLLAIATLSGFVGAAFNMGSLMGAFQ